MSRFGPAAGPAEAEVPSCGLKSGRTSIRLGGARIVVRRGDQDLLPEVRGLPRSRSTAGVLVVRVAVLHRGLALAWPYVFGWPNFDESDAAWALFGLLTGLAFLALLLPCLAVGARRLLDSGKSGAWWFIGLVPFGWVVLLVFFASDGDQGLNRYGPPPVSKPPLPRHRAPFRLHHLLPSGSPRVSSGLESNLVPRVPLLTVAEHHARQRDYFPSTCRVSSL
jgi:uncharacterized membrane protein YhaH (DUF805 family)